MNPEAVAVPGIALAPSEAIMCLTQPPGSCFIDSSWQGGVCEGQSTEVCRFAQVHPAGAGGTTTPACTGLSLAQSHEHLSGFGSAAVLGRGSGAGSSCLPAATAD